MLWAGLLVAALSTAAPRGTVSTTLPPVVLMVRSASTPDLERREKKLFDELGFALDGFMMMSEPAVTPDFSTLPLAEQIAAVLPDARRNGAMAVVWMSFPFSKQVMVHLVALGSGRAFVRTIETDRSSGSEANLALIARELLGTAYLFESPASLPTEIKDVVREVKKSIPPDTAPVVVAAPPPPPPAEAPHLWQLVFDGALRYPVLGGTDAVPVLHLGLGVGRRLPGGFEAALEATFGFGDVTRPGVSGAHFLLTGATLGAFRGFDAGPLSLGPKLSASLAYGSFVTAGSPDLHVWLPEFAAGLFAKTRTARGPSVGIGLFLNWLPIGAQLLAADACPLYRTPVLELSLALSVAWEGL